MPGVPSSSHSPFPTFPARCHGVNLEPEAIIRVLLAVVLGKGWSSHLQGDNWSELGRCKVLGTPGGGTGQDCYTPRWLQETSGRGWPVTMHSSTVPSGSEPQTGSLAPVAAVGIPLRGGNRKLRDRETELSP